MTGKTELTCTKCGRVYTCDPAGTCWCMDISVKLPVPSVSAGAKCLCPCELEALASGTDASKDVEQHHV